MILLKERRKSVSVVKSKLQVVRREEEEDGEEVEEPEEEVIQRDSIYVFSCCWNVKEISLKSL